MTLPAGGTAPGEWSVATAVTTNIPVVAEQDLYWNTSILYRQAASDSTGFYPLGHSGISRRYIRRW
jgi:hypothetical protein